MILSHLLSPKVLEQIFIFSTLQLKTGDDGKVVGFQQEEMLRKALGKERDKRQRRWKWDCASRWSWETRTQRQEARKGIPWKKQTPREYEEEDDLLLELCCHQPMATVRKSCEGSGRPWREVSHDPTEWWPSFHREGCLWRDFNWSNERWWSGVSGAVTPDCGENNEWQRRRE